MSETETMPELKQVLGSLIFGARHPLSVSEMRKNLIEVAKAHGRHTKGFADVKPGDIRSALSELQKDVAESGAGFQLAEIAGTYTFQSDDASGPWLRHFLDADKPHRLSRPALETLAIIAYRQPITRGEIENVRGVNVDHIIRVLLEVQLIRIVGRSQLPGRPMLHGTTKRFLEHFGLADVKHLPGIEELARRERQVLGERADHGVAEDEEGTEETEGEASQDAPPAGEEDESESTQEAD